jgi:hypothetical protein
LTDLMALHATLRPNLSLSCFPGGHMFYTWDESRQRWYAEMQSLYQKVVS